jgi:hypothetical protein
MKSERLQYLAGFAEGLAGTNRVKSPAEARLIGAMMVELVREVAQSQRLPDPIKMRVTAAAELGGK